MGTKKNPGAIDCYGAADPDEPIFTLRATDSSAPILVVMWAEMYRTRKQAQKTWDEKAQNKYHEAIQCAADMGRYFRQNAR